MSQTIIEGNPTFKKETPGDPHLRVAEFFCDTIQGEGVNAGVPATFLRMQGCTLSCSWCDTKEVWRYGNPYTIDELLSLMQTHDVVRKLHNGQHLVLTGGSPLKQQATLSLLITEFIHRFDFVPYIEIENECTIFPNWNMIKYISCWNNSPKLSSSGNLSERRYNTRVLQELSRLKNSWFKFVVTNKADIEEIIKDFIEPGWILWNQVILMPQGATREELEKNRQTVVALAIEYNVRYSSREHIVLWNKKTGV